MIYTLEITNLELFVELLIVGLFGMLLGWNLRKTYYEMKQKKLRK